MSDLDRALGEAIRRARVERGLSLRRLAVRSEGAFKPSSLGGYERGERALSIERFVRLAEALGTRPEGILADALAMASHGGHQEVSIDTTLLPMNEAGSAIAAFAHQVRTRRQDFRSGVITLRGGDLDAIARSAGLSVNETLQQLGPAVLKVGSGDGVGDQATPREQA
jgi:helix-turn-helix protein